MNEWQECRVSGGKRGKNMNDIKLENLELDDLERMLDKTSYGLEDIGALSLMIIWEYHQAGELLDEINKALLKQKSFKDTIDSGDYDMMLLTGKYAQEVNSTRDFRMKMLAEAKGLGLKELSSGLFKMRYLKHPQLGKVVAEPVAYKALVKHAALVERVSKLKEIKNKHLSRARKLTDDIQEVFDHVTPNELAALGWNASDFLRVKASYENVRG